MKLSTVMSRSYSWFSQSARSSFMAIRYSSEDRKERNGLPPETRDSGPIVRRDEDPESVVAADEDPVEEAIDSCD